MLKLYTKGEEISGMDYEKYSAFIHLPRVWSTEWNNFRLIVSDQFGVSGELKLWKKFKI